MPDNSPEWTSDLLPTTQETVTNTVTYKGSGRGNTFEIDLKGTLSTYDDGTYQMRDKIIAQRQVCHILLFFLLFNKMCV